MEFSAVIYCVNEVYFNLLQII